VLDLPKGQDVVVRTRTCAAIIAVSRPQRLSDIYYDRRETVTLGANDAIESKVVHMVDPWRAQAQSASSFEGGACRRHERYRNNRVIRQST
jgi:hypothetical protein